MHGWPARTSGGTPSRAAGGTTHPVKRIVRFIRSHQVRRIAGGLGAVESMLEAGPTRLRPILMTTVATMMAAVPSSLGLGAGAETRGPMAIAVLGGLTLSTALGLLVVPAFYVVTARIKGRLLRKPRTVPTASHAESG